jgi:membrane protein DedA with SNARE-associated domain
LARTAAARSWSGKAWFDRWGQLAVFVGRITPVVRSFISIPAGVFRVPIVPYTLLTLLGSAIWCFGLAGVGWAAGSSYEHFHHDFRFVDYAIAAAVVALVGYIFLRRRSSRLARRAGADSAH